MKILKNLKSSTKIGTRLLGGFYIVVALTAIFGVMFLLLLGAVGKNINHAKDYMVEMEKIADLQIKVGEYLMPGNDIIITKNDGEIEVFNKLDKEIDEMVATLEDKFKARGEEAIEELALVEEIKKGKAGVKAKAEEIFKVYEDTELAGEKMEEMDAEAEKLIETIGELRLLGSGDVEAATKSADSSESSARMVVIVQIIGSFVGGSWLGFILTRSITKPLNKLADGMESIASEGVSEERLKEVEELGKDRGDEIGSLINNFGLITGNLKKQAEDMQKEAQRAKARIYDAIFARDNDRNITYFNDAAVKLTGYSAEEAMKMKCNEVFNADVCGNCAVEQCMKTKEPIVGAQVNIINKSGTKVPVVASVDVLFDERGEVVGGMEIIRDVTQERNMLDKVKEASEKMTESANNLSVVFGQISAATDQVASAIGQVAQGAGEQSKGASEASGLANQISSAIDQVAKGAQDQARSVAQTTNGINELSKAIEAVAKNAQEVNNVVTETKKIAEKGNAATDETTVGMDRIKDVVLESATKIGALGDKSQQIGEIIDVINDIAEQTNLLALNAAIEAARAGEHGKGFAVVADEVRKLAERSAGATKEIAGLIKGIQSGVEEAVESMEKGTSEVEKGAQLAGNAGDAIKEMMVGIEKVVSQMEEVSVAADNMAASSEQVVKAMDSIASITEENTAATEEVAASSEQVVKAVDSIASISQETAASSEEVSASSEQQAASVKEATDSTQELAKIAGELDEMVKNFTL